MHLARQGISMISEEPFRICKPDNQKILDILDKLYYNRMKLRQILNILRGFSCNVSRGGYEI